MEEQAVYNTGVAKKMTRIEKLACWMMIVLCVSTVIFSFLGFLFWSDLQLDKLDYEDERLAMQRACYPFGVPGRNTWRTFRRGQDSYKRWAYR
jgi:hypothetical protein